MALNNFLILYFLCRLKEHFSIATATDKVAVEKVRDFLCNFEAGLTKEECGKIVKCAFPRLSRRRSNNRWFYYGLMYVHEKVEAKTYLDSNPSLQENIITGQQNLSSDNLPAANSACQEVACKPYCPDRETLPEQPDQNTNERQSDARLTHALPKQQSQVNLKAFNIASLNLCEEDISDLSQGQLIGEGTFGKCISGTYKGIPAAFKLYKSHEWLEDVHSEAKILLKIPSHPGIPMLIGVHTTSTPFMLATKLCKSAGKPETYSSFLKKGSNLGLALQLLLSVGEAINHLFSVGILHNDIKGNNVVLEEVQGEKRGVLIDFGKACSFKNAAGLSLGFVHLF